MFSRRPDRCGAPFSARPALRGARAPILRWEDPVVRFRIAALALLFPLASALAACDDPFGGREPLLASDTLTLAAPSVDSLRLGSAIDLLRANTVVFPERIGDAFPLPNWDVALRASNGQLLLRPARTDAGRTGARITTARMVDFAQARSAPESREEYGEDAVVLEEGRVYFVRSRAYAQLGVRCVNFAKIQPVALNAAAGTARLAIVSSGTCNDRRLTG
jgi:hypothetical protein